MYGYSMILKVKKKILKLRANNGLNLTGPTQEPTRFAGDGLVRLQRSSESPLVLLSSF